MQTTQLNLARKWRSRAFDQIIGQDLSVRMLKNSLYLNHFFPVYLFAGQRGCGKTTTARVFASAINCEQLDQFRAQPKEQIVPCLHCASCKAMLAGKHPDFIEMDAASHTGVDNVRQIIDASSLLPLMGRKKIYLIDEAHMLSKAAFNAFLKILEEPPASALFILATTDTSKIIETVRSRCFQLFFKSIDMPILLKHLKMVCKKEQISFDDQGLSLIINETDGSARDALNMLESVRFCAAKVDKAAVLSVLGHIEDERLLALLKYVLRKNIPGVLDILHAIDRSQCSAEFLWNNFLKLLHTCIRLKHGVKPDAFISLIPELKLLLQNVHWKDLYIYLSDCYQQEAVFLKASDQHAFFEMMLLQLCSGAVPTGYNDDSTSGSSSAPQVSAAVEIESDELCDDEQEEQESEDAADFATKWRHCIRDIAFLDDPLVTSIFKQSAFKKYDIASSIVTIEFEQRFQFFQDQVYSAEKNWLPVIKRHFGEKAQCESAFTGQNSVQEKKITQSVVLDAPVAKPAVQPAKQPSYGAGKMNKRTVRPRAINEIPLDISDNQKWPKAHMLLNHFPGKIYEIREQAHV